MQKSRHYKKTLPGFSLEEVFVAKIYDADMQQKLHRFKFVHNYTDSVYFSTLFQTIIQESGIKNFSECILVYPPVSLRDRMLRGPNHAKKLATIFASIAGSRTVLCPFQKRFFSGHQSRRTKEERKKAQHDYSLKPKYIKALQNKDILMIDDIITTGYTVHSLGKLLKRAGVRKITGFFLSSKKA